jgi:hypothetical protein
MDGASVAARPCFLCPANLPAEQLGIACGRNWLALCNPAPIFEPHFVISSVRHEPQLVRAATETVLGMARDLSGAYTVFYNGPASGASAPDHLHIQAVKSGVLPFELELVRELRGPGGWIEWLQSGPVRVGVTTGGRRAAIVLLGDGCDVLTAAIERVVALLGEVHPAQPEPMLNLVAMHGPFGSTASRAWLVCIFPRSAHRPACYGTGPGQFVVSPGCVDLAGVIVAPRPEDFDRLAPEVAAALLEEVLLPREVFERVRASLRPS